MIDVERRKVVAGIQTAIVMAWNDEVHSATYLQPTASFTASMASRTLEHRGLIIPDGYATEADAAGLAAAATGSRSSSTVEFDGSNGTWKLDELETAAAGGGGGPEMMSPAAQAVVIFLYSTVIVVSVSGNGLVIYTVTAVRSMRSVTNFFLLNLACADLLMAVVCVPFTFVANVLIQQWPFGTALCPLVTYAQAVAVFLGAFTLVGISVDRHHAVAAPLRRRLTVGRLAVVVAVIWTAALAFPLPVAVLSRVVVWERGGGAVVAQCEEVWPDERWRYVYSVAVMVSQYFLPLAVLTVTYASIGYRIWIKRPPGEAQAVRDQRIAASKVKVRFIIIIIIIIILLLLLLIYYY